MKKLLVFLCAIGFVFGMSGVASATLYIDDYDAGAPDPVSWWNNQLYMKAPGYPYGPAGGVSSVSWTFDITDDGYNTLTEEIVSADVSLFFSDYDGTDVGYYGYEEASLTVGENIFTYFAVDNTGDAGLTYELLGLFTLDETGMVDATLTATAGNFWFAGSRLTAESVPIPEPATMLLLGTGLIGMAGIGRKKLFK